MTRLLPNELDEPFPKHHHLTLYRGQVWKVKSYLELCNHNVLNIVFDPPNMDYGDIMEQNYELYVPSVPGRQFNEDYWTKIPWDSEILQSFTLLTDITNITFHSFNWHEDTLEDMTLQLLVGNYKCIKPNHDMQCVPPLSYFPRYIWTKEG